MAPKKLKLPLPLPERFGRVRSSSICICVSTGFIDNSISLECGSDTISNGIHNNIQHIN